MGVIDSIRFAADVALGVPSLIGLRPYSMSLETLTWSGDRPGIGTLITTSVPLYNDGYVNPRFRQVSKQEVVLSGGVLKDQDVVIGPFVFPYNDGLGDVGGTDPLSFSPPTNSLVTEFYINIQGPNFPIGGSQFKKIWDNSERNVMYRVYLRNTAAGLP
jgi:hypothetical protein